MTVSPDLLKRYGKPFIMMASDQTLDQAFNQLEAQHLAPENTFLVVADGNRYRASLFNDLEKHLRLTGIGGLTDSLADTPLPPVHDVISMDTRELSSIIQERLEETQNGVFVIIRGDQVEGVLFNSSLAGFRSIGDLLHLVSAIRLSEQPALRENNPLVSKYTCPICGHTDNLKYDSAKDAYVCRHCVPTRPVDIVHPTASITLVDPLSTPISAGNQIADQFNQVDRRSGSLPCILIVTVTKVEAQVVLNAFSQGSEKPWSRLPIGNKMYYDLGIHGGAPIFMAQSEMGTATPGGALLTVRQAIQDLQPQAIIMCGIAFGLRPDKQHLGDILIARQIQCYEIQKVDLKRGLIARGDRVMASERLLSRFRSGDMDWKGAETHFGLVLSGEKLVNDPAFRDELLKTEPEAIGGEMEGTGLYTAARDAKVDWILVKAICDWADGTKDNSAQESAARNATQFVLHVLQLGGWNGFEQSSSSTWIQKPDSTR